MENLYKVALSPVDRSSILCHLVFLQLALLEQEKKSIDMRCAVLNLLVVVGTVGVGALPVAVSEVSSTLVLFECVHLVLSFTFCLPSPLARFHLLFAFTFCLPSPFACVHLLLSFTPLHLYHHLLLPTPLH